MIAVMLFPFLKRKNILRRLHEKLEQPTHGMTQTNFKLKPQRMMMMNTIYLYSTLSIYIFKYTLELCGGNWRMTLDVSLLKHLWMLLSVHFRSHLNPPESEMCEMGTNRQDHNHRENPLLFSNSDAGSLTSLTKP